MKINTSYPGFEETPSPLWHARLDTFGGGERGRGRFLNSSPCVIFENVPQDAIKEFMINLVEFEPIVDLSRFLFDENEVQMIGTLTTLCARFVKGWSRRFRSSVGISYPLNYGLKLSSFHHRFVDDSYAGYLPPLHQMMTMSM